jgi:hypothetical protein
LCLRPPAGIDVWKQGSNRIGANQSRRPGLCRPGGVSEIQIGDYPLVPEVSI